MWMSFCVLCRLVADSQLSIAVSGCWPGHRQVIASADLLKAVGNALFKLVQAFLVGSLGAQDKDARFGSQRASAPTEADHPAVIGPLDVRLHLWVRLRYKVDVPAELDEVPAGSLGLHPGLGDQHRPFPP